MNQEELRRAFLKGDLDKCKFVINREPASLERDRLVLKVLRESGCLMVQFPSAKKERARNEMAGWLDGLLADHHDADIRAGYQRHRRAAHAAEIGFREIAVTRERALVSALDPPRQAWAVIHRVIVACQLSDHDFMEAIKQTGKTREFVDPAQVRLDGMGGAPLGPDDLLECMVGYAGMTLKLLAHKEGWFDGESGELVLPAEVSVTAEDRFKAGSHAYLAVRWSDLDTAWERSRWLDKRLEIATEIGQGRDGQVEASVIVGEDPDENDLLGQIAVVRLREALTHSTLPFLTQWDELKRKLGSTAVLRDCKGCLTEWEIGAQVIFTSLFHWPMDDPKRTFGGLSLRAWIRGYSFLASIQGPLMTSIKLDDLLEGLVKAGQTIEQAKIFVGHATFGRNTRDLFDAPLLRVADETYRIFPPAVAAPNIANIVASRLGSIRRDFSLRRSPHDVAQFERKGTEFEKAMLELLTDAGVNAATFDFQLRGVPYQCDLAAVIDNTLFVFDCKNYSLPMGRSSELSHWLDKLKESRRQVARIAKDLDENPEIVRRHLGQDAHWTRVVPCVLQALPWSQGKGDDGVYVYDQSAFLRLIEVGETRFLTMGGKDKELREIGPQVKLSANAIPTADELLRELENPIQLRSRIPAWKLVGVHCPISETTWIKVPYWSEFPMPLEEKVAAMGLSPSEQKLAMAKPSRSPKASTMMAEALDSVARHQVQPPKMGRNEACRCGSGRKFKKCCGRIR